MNQATMPPEQANELAKRANQHTIHLFYIPKRDPSIKPHPWGSAVLFKDDRRHFLLTAGHVYKNRNPLDYGTYIKRDDFVFFGGCNPRLFEANGLRMIDLKVGFVRSYADLAIIEFDPETVDALSEVYTFLDYREFAHEPKPRLTQYLVFGYPGSKTEAIEELKEFKRDPLVFVTGEMGEKVYSTYNIDRAKIMILAGDLNQVYRPATGKMENLPELGGISGCGVWGIESSDSKGITIKLHSMITGGRLTKQFFIQPGQAKSLPF